MNRSERTPIPVRSTLAVVDNRPGSETVVETKAGIFREVEVDLIMDINTAVSFYNWFGPQLDNLRKGLGITDAQWSQMLGGGR